MPPDLKQAFAALHTLHEKAPLPLRPQREATELAVLLAEANSALLEPTLAKIANILQDPKLSGLHALASQTSWDYQLSLLAFAIAAREALVPLLALDPDAPDASATAERYGALARGEIEAAQKLLEQEVAEASERFKSKKLHVSARRYQHDTQRVLDLAREAMHMRDDDGATLPQGHRLQALQWATTALTRIAEGAGQPRAAAVALAEGLALAVCLRDALPDDPSLSVLLQD